MELAVMDTPISVKPSYFCLAGHAKYAKSNFPITYENSFETFKATPAAAIRGHKTITFIGIIY